MFEYSLFFGFPLADDAYRQELEKIPSHVRLLFMQGGEYLELVVDNQISYLGKRLGDCIDGSSLDLLQDHIISLLKRLVPSYQYNKNDLVLLAIEAQSV